MERRKRDDQMSLREAGQFDKKFVTFGTDSEGRVIVMARRATCGWTRVCQDRATRGVSRKARIRARRQQ